MYRYKKVDIYIRTTWNRETEDEPNHTYTHTVTK